MKAVILAAGKGTRMGDLTKDKPKCMLEFLGRTLLERQIGLFREKGVDEVIVVTGYKSDVIEYPGCVKVKNERYDSTNMVESLFCTRDRWDDTIIVSYGDIIYERRVLEALFDATDDINVVVDLNGAAYFRDRFGEGFLSETESLVLGDDGTIRDIGDPDPEISRVQGQYIGLMKFSPAGLDAMSRVYDTDSVEYRDKRWLRSRNFPNGYMTDMIQRMIDLGNRVRSVGIKSGWLEFDSTGDYDRYLRWQEEGRLDGYYSEKG